jgi:hypothetical protein
MSERYQKFSDTLKNEFGLSTPAKVAKAAKVIYFPLDSMTSERGPTAKVLLKPAKVPRGCDGALANFSRTLATGSSAEAVESKRESETLAGLAALAGGQGQTCIFSSAIAAAFAALERQWPASIPVDRWQRAVDDGCRFLGQWAEQAEALGWTADDLFGLHPAAPLTRYDRMGLVWLLRGKKVVALTAAAATIRTATGCTLSFYRKVRIKESADDTAR